MVRHDKRDKYYWRRYRIEHEEEDHARRRRFYRKHRKKILELRKRWRIKYPEAYRAYWKRYYDDHRNVRKEQVRTHHVRNRKRIHAIEKNDRQLRRERMFKMYGGRCYKCGFDDKRALTLDHVKNNGSEERRALGQSKILRRAIATYLPKEYQVLCMNCQWIKRREYESQ